MPFVFWAEQTPNISTAGVGRSFSLQLHKTSSGFSALRHPTSKTTPPKGNLVPVYHSVRKCQEGFGVLIGLPKRPQHFRNIVVIFCMSCIYFYVSGRSRPTVDHLNLNPPLWYVVQDLCISDPPLWDVVQDLYISDPPLWDVVQDLYLSDPPLWDVVQDLLSIDQAQETCVTVGRAHGMDSTPQYELLLSYRLIIQIIQVIQLMQLIQIRDSSALKDLDHQAGNLWWVPVFIRCMTVLHASNVLLYCLVSSRLPPTSKLKMLWLLWPSTGLQYCA